MTTLAWLITTAVICTVGGFVGGVIVVKKFGKKD